jgi:hypothetical protein
MAIVPCADDIPVVDHDDTHAYVADMDAEGHSHDSQDDCTPFCMCQCCGTSITLEQAAQSGSLKNQFVFSYSQHYSFNYDYHYSNGIWHPPTA